MATVSCWNFRSRRGKDEMGGKKWAQVSMIASLYSQRTGYFPFSNYLPIFTFCKSIFPLELNILSSRAKRVHLPTSP